MHFNEVGVTDKSTIYFSSPSERTKRLFFHTVCIGHFLVEAPYRVRRMRYDSFLLILVEKGKLILQHDNEEDTVLPDEMALIDCYQEHCYYTDSYCEFHFIHFDGPSCRVIADEILKNNPHGCIHHSLRNQFFDLFQDLMHIHENYSPTDDINISNRLYAAVCQLSQITTVNDSIPMHDEHLRDMIRYIQEHLMEPLTVKQFAQASNYSLGHINRIFRFYSGTSLYHYILMCRIARAKFLLHVSKDTVHEIGQKCGFESDANFVRTFKKYTGYTPSEFRKLEM